METEVSYTETSWR